MNLQGDLSFVLYWLLVTNGSVSQNNALLKSPDGTVCTFSCNLLQFKNINIL